MALHAVVDTLGELHQTAQGALLLKPGFIVFSTSWHLQNVCSERLICGKLGQVLISEKPSL